MSDWNYGDAYLRHPSDKGLICFDDDSIVKCTSIFNDDYDFMKRADLVFVDPPWNQGNMRSFYTKAGLAECEAFDALLDRLFDRVAWIAPQTCYVEIGKERLPDVVLKMRGIFPRVTFYNSTYYHKPTNLCYVVRGTVRKGYPPKLDGMDEEDIIDWIGANEQYECIGDLCIGRGLVAMAAKANKKMFVGTELNDKRLSVLLERIVKLGGTYKIEQKG